MCLCSLLFSNIAACNAIEVKLVLFLCSTWAPVNDVTYLSKLQTAIAAKSRDRIPCRPLNKGSV
jgi:hypothetical protein